MKIREIEMAIDTHGKAFEQFVKCRASRGPCFEKLIEAEFAARRILNDGRGESIGAEIKRLTYLAGFMIVSRVLQDSRLQEGGCDLQN